MRLLKPLNPTYRAIRFCSIHEKTIASVIYFINNGMIYRQDLLTGEIESAHVPYLETKSL